MSFLPAMRRATALRFCRGRIPAQTTSRTIASFEKKTPSNDRSILQSSGQAPRPFQCPFKMTSNPSTRSFATHPDGEEVVFPDFKRCLGDQSYLVVDVREPEELAEVGRIAGAVNIPLGRVDTEFSKSPEEICRKYHTAMSDEDGSNIVFFCRSGVRAEKALRIAQKHGYTMARFYKGSFNDWVAHNEPVVK